MALCLCSQSPPLWSNGLEPVGEGRLCMSKRGFNRWPLIFMNRKIILPIIILLLAVGYWFLPISGDLFVVLTTPEPGDWPTLRFEPEAALPGQPVTLVVGDTVPWVHVKLLINGETEAELVQTAQNPLGWEWYYSFTVPEGDGYRLSLFHDCDKGCVEWTEREINTAVNLNRIPANTVPTKLGVVFANPDRDWHNRAGWVVELTYAELADAAYWGVDDVAQRVQTAVASGQRVLLRVDYAQNQTLPPPEDPAALESYLAFLRRLARDDRFADLYGIIIGSSLNSPASNSQGALSPDWVARVFNGYSTPPEAIDNVVGVVRSERPTARLLVGSIQPWLAEPNGEQAFIIDAPWLNYFHTLVTYLGESSAAKTAVGIPFAAPDGFAVQAFGQPTSLLMGNLPPDQEPLTSLPDPAWNNAQAGFGIYQDWLAVINANEVLRGTAVFITATNTYDPASGTPPAQNYPAGWLTNALTAINAEPQIASLCWFVDDFSFDAQWEAFSLTQPQGNLSEAATEFEELLK